MDYFDWASQRKAGRATSHELVEWKTPEMWEEIVLESPKGQHEAIAEWRDKPSPHAFDK